METFQNTQPIYIQIMDLLKKKIATSELSPGQLLEPVRELAMTYQVNPNTVQRALSELEREGLVHSERTAGRFVTEDVALIEALHRGLFDTATTVYIDSVKALNIDSDTVINTVKDRLKGENK
jgi:GntR family transcriptional regulator